LKQQSRCEGEGATITASRVGVHAETEVFLGVCQKVPGVNAAPPPPLLVLPNWTAEQRVEHVLAGGLAAAIQNHRPVHVLAVHAIVREDLGHKARIPFFRNAGGDVPVEKPVVRWDWQKRPQRLSTHHGSWRWDEVLEEKRKEFIADLGTASANHSSRAGDSSLGVDGHDIPIRQSKAWVRQERPKRALDELGAKAIGGIEARDELTCR